MPENPDKKSSWKSLAGNLFGIEFDDQNSLDDLDLDSVADAVEELNTPQAPHDHDCSRDHDHDCAHDHDDIELNFDFESPEVAKTKPAPAPVEKNNSAGPVSSIHPTSMKKTDPPVSSSSDRSSYEDEDLFGFGIMVDRINEELDDEGDDVAEVVTDSPVADSAPEVSASTTPETPVSEEAEISLEEFDFDFDFEDDEPVAPPKASRKTRETPAPAASKQPTPEKSETVEPVLKSDDAPQADAELDDFWASLEEWDWSKESSSKSSSNPQKPRRGRRSSSRDEDERDEVLEQVEEETPVAEVELETEEFADEETSDEDRPRKRPRRRRRRSRSREASASEATQEAAVEVDPEDIDRLWGDDEETTSEAAPEKSVSAEPKRISRTDREDKGRRGRGRREASPSETAKVESPAPPAEASEVESELGDFEMVEDIGDENTRKYKNVPTWTEAIGMIVRRRDPAASGSRQRRESGRSGDERRSSQPRRKPRRREE